MPPNPKTIDDAFDVMKAAYIGTLVNNAVDALVDGEVRAATQLRMPINFQLISSRAVEATKGYRQQLERFGGSEITVVDEAGRITREFKPWLKTAIESEKEAVGKIIQDAIKKGSSIDTIEAQLNPLFDTIGNNSRTVAYNETKKLYNEGTFNRFADENIQRGIFRHMDPQDDPREDHQALDGMEFDLDDPVWALLDEIFCHCWCEPVLNLGTFE
jgi:SPP1 gp7 family putative phage head morphogenesis protein